MHLSMLTVKQPLAIKFYYYILTVSSVIELSSSIAITVTDDQLRHVCPINVVDLYAAKSYDIAAICVLQMP